MTYTQMGRECTTTSFGESLVEEYDYYPFGETARHLYYSIAYDRSGRFSGNEMLGEFNDRIYDFNARLYSPYMGRFYSMDPLCENQYDISPYVYCNNNPVNYVDPKGWMIIELILMVL